MHVYKYLEESNTQGDHTRMFPMLNVMHTYLCSSTLECWPKGLPL